MTTPSTPNQQDELWGKIWSLSLKYLDMVRHYEAEDSEDYFTYRDYIARELADEVRGIIEQKEGSNGNT